MLVFNIDLCNNPKSYQDTQDMEAKDEFPFGQDFEWQQKQFLGEGSFGKVFKVKAKKTEEFFAIKQMKMQVFNKDPMLMNSLKGQIGIQSNVNSEYTVKMVAHSFGKDYTYIILEICDSDLRKDLASRKFSEEEYIKAFGDVINGFRVLVSKGYIHRDIKPANVLNKNGIYKIADFGFACQADIMGHQKLKDICGTPIYMAPQLLRRQTYTAKSDIWSLGLMLYEIVFGYTPWPSRSHNEYLNNIYGKPLKFPYNANIGANTKDFIKRSLVIEQHSRMSWEEVFQHPLVKNKSQGIEAPHIKVNDYVKDILVRIQEDIQRKQINVNQILAPFLLQSVSQGSFVNLVRKISPAVTSHEVQTLFTYLDSKKEGWVDWPTIQENLFNVDYRDTGDVLSRKLDEIVAIINQRNEDLQFLFSQIDINSSGQLDFSEFSKFVGIVAPCYTKQEVLQFFKLFDIDKNGLISKQEFMNLLMRKMPHKEESISNDRARRNLRQLKQFLKWSSISAQTIMLLADTNKDHHLNLEQFQKLLNQRVSFHISKEQARELFSMIDTSHNNSISVQELGDLLK